MPRLLSKIVACCGRKASLLSNATLLGPILLFLMVLIPSAANGGGGPENLFLVINSNSQNSMEVGNHYCRIQDLPASHVLHLPYEGDLESVTGEVFRSQILMPILKAINQRGLAPQIDMITYSCDMPWRVDFRGTYPKLPNPFGVRAAFGSTTGSTYLWQMAFNNDPNLTSLHSNWYVPIKGGENFRKCVKLGDVPTRGFRGRYFWAPNSNRISDPKKGRRYFLSTMLGVTTGRGNSVEEVIASLRRSSYANVVPPVGAFYYVKNKDVRSVTRHACYAEVVNQLKALGAKAYVTQGVLPNTKGPVLGMMLGKDTLPLHKAQFTVQPGAICEHLTSFGGMLKNKNWQTPITDLIRLGASGVSGTVTEPTALQAKFPLPTVHLHYRRGSSLAEAFYQSVSAPFQLLVIGDPLCQPWANRPQVVCEGWEPEGQVPLLIEERKTKSKKEQQPKQPIPSAKKKTMAESMDDDTSSEAIPQESLVRKDSFNKKNGQQEIKSTEQAGNDRKQSTRKQKVLRISPRVISSSISTAKPSADNKLNPSYWELFVDGKLAMRLPSGREARVVVDSLKPGWHALRCVGFNPDAIESQGVLKGWFQVPAEEETAEGGRILENRRLTVTLATDKPVVAADGEVKLMLQSKGAQAIIVRQFAREVARFKGSEGGLSLPVEQLGKGPIRLQAYAEPSGAASPPLWIVVE